MTIGEYKKYIDGLTVDELVEIVRLSRLSGVEKDVVEAVDIYERRLKDVYYDMDMEPRKLDKILQRARDKIIRRVIEREKGVNLAEIRRTN